MNKFFKGAAIGTTMLCVALTMGAPAYAKDSDDAKADAKAKILRKVSVEKTSDLDFATVVAPAAGAAAASITLNSSGALTCGTGAICTGDAKAAGFDIKASKNQALDVAVTGLTKLKSTQGTTTYEMPISFGGVGNPTSVTTGKDGKASIAIGAVLTVAADQMDGDYEGEFTVTVSYE